MERRVRTHCTYSVSIPYSATVPVPVPVAVPQFPALTRTLAPAPLPLPPSAQLNITSGELKTGLGGALRKEFNIRRRIKISYLDATLRVATFLPDAALPDSEADGADAVEGRSQEEIVFVFRRVASASPPSPPQPKAAAVKAEEEEVRDE